MNENDFWIAVWRTVGITLIAIVALMAGCSTVADSRVVEMVQAGANPIAARCAIWGANNSSLVTCHEAAKYGR